MRKKFSILILTLIILIAVQPVFAAPATTITFVEAPSVPVELTVGETYTAVFEVESDGEFISATAMPDPYFPGRIVHTKPVRVGSGSSATLEMTFTGIANTTNTIDNTNPVAISVGVRYPGGEVVVETFDVDFVLVE